MGKTKIVKKEDATEVKKAANAASKRRMEMGILNIQSTFNNTKIVLADPKGNTLTWATSGSLGFKGAKKGTPFAAAKIAEVLADKAIAMGMKEVTVVVKGVGSGRESAIRTFISKGINIAAIKDATPVPHNGCKPKKPRRV